MRIDATIADARAMPHVATFAEAKSDVRRDLATVVGQCMVGLNHSTFYIFHCLSPKKLNTDKLLLQ